MERGLAWHGAEVEGKTPELQGDEGPAPKVAPQRGAPGKQRQRGLLLPSLAGTEELFRGKGFSFFLSKPALREDESLPAWVAQCSHGAGDLGAPWPLFGVFGFHFQQKCAPAPPFSPQELCLLSQHRWELEGAVSQRPLVGTGLSPDSQCGGQRWIQVFKRVTT